MYKRKKRKTFGARGLNSEVRSIALNPFFPACITSDILIREKERGTCIDTAIGTLTQ